ncbi:hypothetical protein HZ326_6097, partial [Fusarium oxysporum f. sp. albedinis]
LGMLDGEGSGVSCT